MSIVRTCCNKELADSCIYCCDGRYCTDTEQVIYDWLDGSCSGYVNKDVFREHLTNMWEELDNGKYRLMSQN